jgi:predicted esterase
MRKAFWEWWGDESKFLQVLLLHGMGSDAFQLFGVEVEYGQSTVRRGSIQG